MGSRDSDVMATLIVVPVPVLARSGGHQFKGQMRRLRPVLGAEYARSVPGIPCAADRAERAERVDDQVDAGAACHSACLAGHGQGGAPRRRGRRSRSNKDALTPAHWLPRHGLLVTIGRDLIRAWHSRNWAGGRGCGSSEFWQRLWIPLVVLVVIAAGGYVVSRVHGIFGSEKRPSYADGQH